MEALYKKWHNDGLEIVGINLDPKPEQGQKACEALGLTYPEVWIPGDARTGELWAKASGIASVPRVLLIDRDGVLRADCGSDQVEKEIKRLLGVMDCRKPKEEKP